MAQENTNLPPTADQEAKGFIAKNKVTIILLLVIALSNTGIYLYQNSKISGLKDGFAEKYQTQVDKVNKLMEYRAESSAAYLGGAVAFACGPEMATGDKQRLNLFFIDMVQKTDVELISIVDTLGYVYLSTDKNYETKSILEVVPTLPGRIDDATLQKVSSEEFLYAAPIEYGRRMGTLVLDYKTDAKTRKMVEEIADFPKDE